MIKHLPNFLTCCNLIAGALGIIVILRNPDWQQGQSWLHPAYFVWIACVFDFFDGFAARALKVSSPIGKELDSLADVISFGLLPSLFMFTLIESSTAELNTPVREYLPFVALSIAVFSALRLAIFNVDETQSDSFRGVPTPANTIFITAIPFLGLQLGALWLVVISLICSFLLVSPINLFALKFKDFSWTNNKVRFIFIALSAVLLIALQFAALPLIIIMYILLSLGVNRFT